MKISKRKQILTRYDGPRENVKRKEKSDKYKSENILVDFLERANTSAAHNTLTYKNSRQSPRTAIQEQEQMGNVCNLHKGKADISIKLVKVFQNSGDCVAFDEKECVIHVSAVV